MTKISPLNRTNETINHYSPEEVFVSPKMIQKLKDKGFELPNLENIRTYRRKRVLAEMEKRRVDALLLFDPINIRYSTDSSNMQLWTAHNLARAALVTVDGHFILWDFTNCQHMTEHLHRLNEVRTVAGSFYFEFGDTIDNQARSFCAEVKDVLAQRGLTGPIGIDRMDTAVAKAFFSAELDIVDAMTVMEHARVVKSPDEILAMRCGVENCDMAMAEMEKAMMPGMSEVELWSILHKENIANGGEWLETRILSSGPRTNPWMREASGRIMQDGDIMAFDTDMIGLFGICIDTSRTWLVGDAEAKPGQIEAYKIGHEHIETNAELLAPGVSMRDLTFKGHVLPDAYQANKYCVKMHGVGLCDEFPSIYYPDSYIEGAFDYHLEPGMVLCVEVFAGKEDGLEGVKLENQVLVTETGFENLTTYPYDKRLMGLS